MQRPINHCSSLQWYHSLKRSKPGLLCFAIFVVYLAKYFPQLPQKLLQKSKCGCINAWYIDFNVVCGKRCLARFTAPIPEATFFMSFSICLLQSSLSSIMTPNDLVLVTCLTLAPLIVSVGETVRLLCLCLDPMRMNSVLVIVRVNLFALNQL